LDTEKSCKSVTENKKKQTGNELEKNSLKILNKNINLFRNITIF
jgi:hypothetical protein